MSARRITFRGLFLLVVPAVTIVLAEGTYSLFTGRSLTARLLSGDTVSLHVAKGDLNQFAHLTQGPYALDRDPEVGFRMKAGHKGAFVSAPFSTDAYGDRVRIGPEPQARAKRVVVLGDSVAFGFGVEDNETYAHRIEEALFQGQEDGVRPWVKTVACPGWNYRSSFRYLRNHIERYQPDIVLYIAVPNDLDDASVVNEIGLRSMGTGLNPRVPQASIEAKSRLINTLVNRPSHAERVKRILAGQRGQREHVLRTGVTSESKRRWKAYLDSIVALHASLSRLGTRFAVILPFEKDFHRQLEIRLGSFEPGGAAIPVFGLLDRVRKEDKLVGDPHPNPACIEAGALRMARFLVEKGWVEGDLGRLPQDADGYRDRRYALLSREVYGAFLDELEERSRRDLGPEVDLMKARGLHQVYGGLLGDGTVGKHISFGLHLEGATSLEIELERQVQAVELEPLIVELEVQGISLAEVRIPPVLPGDGLGWSASFQLPEDCPGPLFDVVLRSSAHRFTRGKFGDHLLSYKLNRVALVKQP